VCVCVCVCVCVLYSVYIFFIYYTVCNLYFCMYVSVCPDPPEVANAEVSNGTVTVGSVRTYSCVGGLSMTGDPTVTCIDDTTWSEKSFFCAGNTLYN
jgi:hypothetical protein